jgi:hypothetical protein
MKNGEMGLHVGKEKKLSKKKEIPVALHMNTLNRYPKGH